MNKIFKKKKCCIAPALFSEGPGASQSACVEPWQFLLTDSSQIGALWALEFLHVASLLRIIQAAAGPPEMLECSLAAWVSLGGPGRATVGLASAPTPAPSWWPSLLSPLILPSPLSSPPQCGSPSCLPPFWPSVCLEPSIALCVLPPPASFPPQEPVLKTDSYKKVLITNTL